MKDIKLEDVIWTPKYGNISVETFISRVSMLQCIGIMTMQCRTTLESIVEWYETTDYAGKSELSKEQKEKLDAAIKAFNEFSDSVDAKRLIEGE